MILELKSISKSFGNSIILKNISLQIHSGETIAITGPSGSGKTTLLNIIGTLDKPDSGNVLFFNKDISSFTENESADFRNTEIGFVFQKHYLLPQCTLLENVLIPTLTIKDREEKQKRKEFAISLLQRVGLEKQMHQMPGELSGGECQRASFVRALIKNPKLLLADEPTGSLDQESAAVLGQLLHDLNSENNTTLIVVTHSPELAGKMKKIFVLKDGELVL